MPSTNGMIKTVATTEELVTRVHQLTNWAITQLEHGDMELAKRWLKQADDLMDQNQHLLKGPKNI